MSIILEKAFLYWPVSVLGVSEGWVYGTYVSHKMLPHRDLMQKGRVRIGRLKRGRIPNFSEAQINESFLHHEALGVALEAERILLETEELNEERYFERMFLVPKERTIKAFEEFVNLEAKDPQAAERFISEFGEFDYLELKKNRFVGGGIPAKIQQFCQRALRENKEPFAVSLRDFWSTRQDILSLLRLWSAVSRQNVADSREECIRRRSTSTFDRKPNWPIVGKAILCADLSASLNPGRRNPRLVLTERAGKLVVLTMGTTVRMSLYLTLLDIIVSKTGYKKCPNCAQHFIVTGRHERRFCTDACRNAAKVRRWRSRHKVKRPVL